MMPSNAKRFTQALFVAVVVMLGVARASYVPGTAITTLGTVTTGTWSATAIAATKGGTAQTSWTAGDILYASATDTLSKLAKGSDGQVLTLSSGLPAWASASTSTAYCRVHNSTNQSLNNNTNTLFTFDTEDFDPSNMHSTVSNTGRLTFATAGRYLVTASVRWNPTGAGERQIYIDHSNSGGSGLAQAIDGRPATGTGECASNICLFINAASGDYVTLSGRQQSGGALVIIGTQAFFSAIPQQ